MQCRVEGDILNAKFKMFAHVCLTGKIYFAVRMGEGWCYLCAS